MDGYAARQEVERTARQLGMSVAVVEALILCKDVIRRLSPEDQARVAALLMRHVMPTTGQQR